MRRGQRKVRKPSPTRKPRFRRSRVGRRLRQRAIDLVRKEEFDNLLAEHFCDEGFPVVGKTPLVSGRTVIPYALERLRKLNDEQACQGMEFDGSTYRETSSKKPDVVLRIDEGPVAPLSNETTPEQAVGMVHNYVIVLVRNPVTGTWESRIEFLRMNLVEVRSKHAHIILSKIDPERRGEFLYVASGECMFDGRMTIVNIQSGMNWEINLSRPGISLQVEETRSRMASGPSSGRMSKIIARGVGPKNDFWGAIAVAFFREVLGYPNVEYGTSTLRKKTMETRETIQRSWCNQGVGVEEYSSRENCQRRMGGRNLCSEPFGKQIAPSSGEIDQQDLNTLTVARLREMLETLGVEIIGRPRKAELISMIEEFLS